MLQSTRTISRSGPSPHTSWARACVPRQGLQQMRLLAQPLAAASSSAAERAGRNIVLAIDTDAQGEEGQHGGLQ